MFRSEFSEKAENMSLPGVPHDLLPVTIIRNNSNKQEMISRSGKKSKTSNSGQKANKSSFSKVPTSVTSR